MSGNTMRSLNFDLGDAADMLPGSAQTFADGIAPHAAAIDRGNAEKQARWR